MTPRMFRGSGVLVPGLAALALATSVAPRAAGVASGAPPTWAGDVAPLIYANCSSCHRPGQSAPFALLSYEDVRQRADTILNVTARRYMPPWHAARAPGFLELRDERRLTDADLAMLKAWVAADMPVGDPRKAPVPPSYAVGWPLGVPDLIVSMPNPIDVPAVGHDVYRNVTLGLDLPIDRWLTAIDYQPSARSVVHHALFFVEPASVVVSETDVLPGLGRALLAGRGQGAGARIGAADEAWGGLGGWVPGVTPKFFPDGIAQPLPKHSNIIMQLHLHPSGRDEREDGKLALYFARLPPKKSLTGVQVPPAFGFAVGLDIPAGEKRFIVRDAFTLPVDVDAYGARGHAHYLGREMKMTAALPNGSTRGLLWIDKWDFAWQDSYYFKSPLKLPKGTRLDVELVYDNSTENPANPNAPPVRVRWGRESTDEMGSLTLLVAAPTPDDARTLRDAQAQHFREQLARRLRR